ncbi:hypothetical protein ACOME3_000081 [Neoechinorhynchus agilis]
MLHFHFLLFFMSKSIESAMFFEKDNQTYQIISEHEDRREKRSIPHYRDTTVDHIMKSIDFNGDHKISQKELRKFVGNKMNAHHDRQISKLCGDRPHRNDSSISFDLVFVAKHGLPALNAYEDALSLPRDEEDLISRSYIAKYKDLIVALYTKELALWYFVLKRYESPSRFLQCSHVNEVLWPSEYEHCRQFLAKLLMDSLNFNEIEDAYILEHCGGDKCRSKCTRALENAYFPNFDTKVNRHVRIIMRYVDQDRDNFISEHEIKTHFKTVHSLLFDSFGKLLRVVKRNERRDGKMRCKRSDSYSVTEIDDDMFGPNNPLQAID